jgi:hypothetical protein
MLLGLTRPDRGELSLFGMSPADAVAHGEIGAMLQTGKLIPDLPVREIVAIGGGTGLLAFLGGTWFSIPDSGFLHDVAQGIPSYWLVQASHIAVGGDGWGRTGWLVIAGVDGRAHRPGAADLPARLGPGLAGDGRRPEPAAALPAPRPPRRRPRPRLLAPAVLADADRLALVLRRRDDLQREHAVLRQPRD